MVTQFRAILFDRESREEAMDPSQFLHHQHHHHRRYVNTQPPPQHFQHPPPPPTVQDNRQYYEYHQYHPPPPPQLLPGPPVYPPLPASLPPPPPPYNPHQPQFTFRNPSSGFPIDGGHHAVREISGEHHVLYQKPEFNHYSDFNTRNVWDSSHNVLPENSRGVWSYPAVDSNRDSRHHIFDKNLVQPHPVLNEFRHDSEGSSKVRVDYNNHGHLQNGKEEFVSHDNGYGCSSRLVSNHVKSCRTSGFENSQDFNRQPLRNLPGSSLNEGHRNSADSSVFSGKRLSRENTHEYDHIPRKQTQKKSAFLRIQKVKPNLRNKEFIQIHPFEYYDNSNSSPFKGKETHAYHSHRNKQDETEREGSPVELDVSFKANLLVAKPIISPSSPRVTQGRNLTQVSNKKRKLLSSDIVNSSSPKVEVSSFKSLTDLTTLEGKCTVSNRVNSNGVCSKPLSNGNVSPNVTVSVEDTSNLGCKRKTVLNFTKKKVISKAQPLKKPNVLLEAALLKKKKAAGGNDSGCRINLQPSPNEVAKLEKGGIGIETGKRYTHDRVIVKKNIISKVYKKPKVTLSLFNPEPSKFNENFAVTDRPVNAPGRGLNHFQDDYILPDIERAEDVSRHSFNNGISANLENANVWVLGSEESKIYEGPLNSRISGHVGVDKTDDNKQLFFNHVSEKELVKISSLEGNINLEDQLEANHCNPSLIIELQEKITDPNIECKVTPTLKNGSNECSPMTMESEVSETIINVASAKDSIPKTTTKRKFLPPISNLSSPSISDIDSEPLITDVSSNGLDITASTSLEKNSPLNNKKSDILSDTFNDLQKKTSCEGYFEDKDLFENGSNGTPSRVYQECKKGEPLNEEPSTSEIKLFLNSRNDFTQTGEITHSGIDSFRTSTEVLASDRNRFRDETLNFEQQCINSSSVVDKQQFVSSANNTTGQQDFDMVKEIITEEETEAHPTEEQVMISGERISLEHIPDSYHINCSSDIECSNDDNTSNRVCGLDNNRKDKLDKEAEVNHLVTTKAPNISQSPSVVTNKRKNHPNYTISRTLPGRASVYFTNSGKASSSKPITNPRTWSRTDNSVTVPPLSQSLQKIGKVQNTSYVRKGNSLVRKPPIAPSPLNSQCVISSVFRSSPSRTSENQKSNVCGNSVTSESQNGQINSIDIQCDSGDNLDSSNTRKILSGKPKLNKLVSTISVDKTDSSSSDDYYKRKNNQLIRTTVGTPFNQQVAVPSARLKLEEKRAHRVNSSKSARKRWSGTHKPSKSSLVWTLHRPHPLKEIDNLMHRQKVLPHLLPWKRRTYQKKFRHDLHTISGNNSTPFMMRGAVYTRSPHGLSLRKSKVLSVAGRSLKWSMSIEKRKKKANKDATLAVAVAEKKKREENGTVSAINGVKTRNNSFRERIYRIGSDRYKMDSSRMILQRISDNDASSSDAIQEKVVRKSYVPKRLVIDNNEYVRIGNGNQLIRDPKKRIRTLANDKIRWSLHTARLRLAKKKKYCQFFTRYGKCNKQSGKCPYIHDTSKIAVCTKFLKGLCSNPNCKLTHKVIPERMQDCSYFMQGLCSNENCPYRHVKVNVNASTCEGFLRGFCADGDECRKKHSYVCQDFEATGTCPRGSKCKLHHPKKNEVKKKTQVRESNALGRYFGSPRMDVANDERIPVKLLKNNNDDDENIFLADYISLDVSDEEFEEAMDVSRNFDDVNLSNGQGDDFDQLIRPIRIMDIIRRCN